MRTTERVFDWRCARSKEGMPNSIVCFSRGERSPQIQSGDVAGIACTDSGVWQIDVRCVMPRD